MEDNKDNDNLKQIENEKEENNNEQNKLTIDEKTENLKGENLDNNNISENNKEGNIEEEKKEGLEETKEKEEEKNNEELKDNKNEEIKKEIITEKKEEIKEEIKEDINKEKEEEKKEENKEGKKEDVIEEKKEEIKKEEKEEIIIENKKENEEEKKEEIKEDNKKENEENNKEEDNEEKKEENKEEKKEEIEDNKKEIINEKKEEKIERGEEKEKGEIKEEIKEDKSGETKEEKKEEKEEEKKEEEKKEISNDIKEENNNEKNKENNEPKNNEDESNPLKNEQKNEVNEASETSNNIKMSVTMKILDNNILGETNDIEKQYKLPKDFIDDKDRCNSLTQKLVNKTKINANMKLEEFFTKKRHYLIMTDGGKPVYSRYGDEVENNSIFATISAMITKFTIFNSTDSFKEDINIISNNKNKIVFVKKGQLIFIALSKKVNDSVSFLHSQLEYMYNQLMSILTVRFYEKLEDNPSKCLTAMGGTEHLFEQIIQYSSNSFVSLFNSYQIMNCLNFGESRDKINRILEDNKGNALYCILMTPYEIISFAHSNQIAVTSSDLILIQNLIFCTEMMRTEESYVPICLPGISDQGFLQLYSHFSEENIGIIFVTENTDPMCFMEFQKKYNDIYNKLKNGYVEKIVDCMRKNNNVKGKYSLFKNNNNNKEKKQKLTDEALINKLLNIITKEKGMKIEDNNDEKNQDDNMEDSSLNNINKSVTMKQEMLKSKTIVGNFNTKNDLNVNNIYSLFNKVKYGVVFNKKYNQYIMLNFGMDYRNYDKKEKNLLHKYHQIYDIYINCTKEKDNNKDRDNYYYIEKSNNYYNVILVNDPFILICSFSFFSGDIEDLFKRSREIIKYLKKYENKYFIIYK